MHNTASNPVDKETKPYEGDNGNSNPEAKPDLSLEMAWDDPISPGQTEGPDIPASLLPGWLGDYVDAVSKNTQTPPGLAVMMALSVIATCSQKKFEVSPYGDDYREPLQLWMVTALPPGSRKTAVVNWLNKPLMAWEEEQSEKLKTKIDETNTKIAINQKAIEHLEVKASKDIAAAERSLLTEQIGKLKADTPDKLLYPRLWTGDVTPERLQSLMADHGEKMSLLSDEGGIFEIMAGLYSNGSANLDVFNQAHAGSPVRVDRGGRTVHLKSPALTFGLAIQPEVLNELGNGNKRRFRGIGTLARFLYCVPKSNIGDRDPEERVPIPEDVKRTYNDKIIKLLEIPPLLNDGDIETTRILTLSPEAFGAWLAFAKFIEKRQGEGKEFEAIQDWTAKLPGASLRVAGNLHVAIYGESSLVISRETMAMALDICDVLIPQAQIAFNMMGTDQTVEDAKVIFKWILKETIPFFNKGVCHHKFRGRFKKVDRLNLALDVLHGWNVISDLYVVKPKGKDGGRPAKIYYVNPKIYQDSKIKEETNRAMA